MRILLVNSHDALVGGVERYLERLLPALESRGHSIALLFEHAPKANRLESEPAPLSALVPHAPAWHLASTNLGGVLGPIRDWQPDLVFVHALRSIDLEEQLLANYPCYLFAHDHYRTCPAGAKTHAFPVLEPCRRPASPTCLALHFVRRCGGLNPLTGLHDFQRWQQTINLARRYERIFVASTYMAEALTAQGIGLSRLVLAPPPVSLDSGHDLPPDPRPFTNRLLFLGRLEAVKGAATLLGALPEAERRLRRSLELVLAGDGPQMPALERFANQHHRRVRFPGWVDVRERSALFQNSDLLIVPSLWPEPYGLVGSEAAAWGTPAVGFPVGGIREWLQPGTTGELASPGPLSSSALAVAIVRALRDPAHHQSLRIGAWTAARRRTLAPHLELLEKTWHAFEPATAHSSVS